ncbi:Ohr family peroxiredoxin [Aerococcaceae bacterium DSM 109653]|uniref:Ohr family peroxiredoxin n=1 Tax=Fundicoccus ignavus TaxID=2664442 RepID=A0A844BXE3_9LACT|nr:organic hydroperoxide resistance protein [Fundicoccus ignavus]MRI81146.1 Ohr family peroxiredoxin [Fundicoccus ignavus]
MSDYQQLYETSAVNTGGHEGLSYLEDGSFEIKKSTPKAMGGKSEGQNPEQLFALGYGACFHGALELVKGQHKVKNASQVLHTVRLFKKPDAADFKLEVEIQVGIQDFDRAETQKLADEAHTVCPYSKAVAGNIDVYLKAAYYDAGREK